MSRDYASNTHPYWLEAYYGPGGRKNSKNRAGEREGDLCIAIEYGDKHSREMEFNILRKREDIGVINMGINGWE